MVIFPLAPDQTIAQMWSNGARGGRKKWRIIFTILLSVICDARWRYQSTSRPNGRSRYVPGTTSMGGSDVMAFAIPLFKVVRQSNDLPMPYHVSIKILTDFCVLDFCWNLLSWFWGSCHQMPDFMAKIHQNRFPLVLCSRPCCGAYSTPQTK